MTERTVSVIVPVLTHSERDRIMTSACFEIMRATTEVPFELVVSEAGAAHFAPDADRHIIRPTEGSSYTQDFNAGIDEASGELLVHTGNDLFMGDFWLETMLDVFERFPDAGAASPAVLEPAAFIGPQWPEDTVCESFFGALFMFRREWQGQAFRLDEGYPNTFSDVDLCMQLYEAGLRTYRNNACVCRHLKEMTIYTDVAKDKQHAAFVAGAKRFNAKWRDRPWLMKSLLIKGQVHMGREHEPIYPGLDG